MMIKRLAILTVIISLSACSVIIHKNYSLFGVRDAKYQSWMREKDLKGTDIILELINVDTNVEFKKITFRSVTVPVYILSQKGNVTIIKGVINAGPSLLEDEERTNTDSDNMLIYTYKDQEFSFPLKNIRRLKTMFYK